MPECARAVRSWIRKRGNSPGPLFPSRQKTAISRFRVFQLMRRYCKIADIPLEKAHPHSLRHACAVHLLVDQKEGVVNVQRHLGHADVRSTMVYLRGITDEYDEERIRRLASWK